MKIDSVSTDEISTVPPSYQTAPLIEYDSTFRARADDLYERVVKRMSPSRAKRYKGSFSILASSNEATAAKIVIYQSGKGKINGTDPSLIDGVYILVRTANSGKGGKRTIGIAPKHGERFAYLRLMPAQDLDETAEFIAACANADKVWST